MPLSVLNDQRLYLGGCLSGALYRPSSAVLQLLSRLIPGDPLISRWPADSVFPAQRAFARPAPHLRPSLDKRTATNTYFPASDLTTASSGVT